MKYLLLISYATFTLYLVTILVFFGTPKSLSASYYLIKKRLGKPKPYFTITLMIMGATLMPMWLELSEGSNYQFLSFLAPISIIYVGIAPRFKQSLEGKVHKSFAILSAICSLLWVIFVSPYSYLALISGIVVVIAFIFALRIIFGKYQVKGNITFWAEMFCFFTTYNALAWQIFEL